jgi:hypothetical protein
VAEVIRSQSDDSAWDEVKPARVKANSSISLPPSDDTPQKNPNENPSETIQQPSSVETPQAKAPIENLEFKFHDVPRVSSMVDLLSRLTFWRSNLNDETDWDEIPCDSCPPSEAELSGVPKPTVIPPAAMLQLDPTKPFMSYTRLFDGTDADLLATLRDYLELSGDQRSGGWEGYLHRSEDFMRFTAHLMIVEMLTLHGGEAKRRIVFKLRKLR